MQIAEGIDEKNAEWNDAYGTALNAVIDVAISSGATDVQPQDERGKDLLSDIIEEQHLVYESDMASICFESRFDFNSLRKCLEDQEDQWLEDGGTAELIFANAPTIQETIEDEEFWTVITCNKEYVIANKDVTPEMLDGMTSEQQRTLIEKIQDIVKIIGDIVNIGEQLHNLFADCSGTSTAADRNKRDGFQVNGQEKWIGYVMIQKSVLIDFANKTTTKIKGKARIYKKKANGKLKKDKRTVVGISFCAKEWNSCDGGREWPSDPGPYKHPRAERKKKAKVKLREPKALSIEYSTHYLQFRFGVEGVFDRALNLLGSDGCVRASNTDW